MADIEIIQPIPRQDPVLLIEKDDLVEGGYEGAANKQAIALLNNIAYVQERTYSKSDVDDISASLQKMIKAAEKGIIFYETQAQLLAAQLGTEERAAQARDTSKIFLWKITSAAGVTPVVWGWVDTGQSDYEKIKALLDSNANFTPVKIDDISLSTLTSVGVYLATTTAFARLDNDYPIEGMTGILHVVNAKNSSLVFQEFKALNGSDYWRSYNGSTWTIWKLKFDLAPFEKKESSFTDLGVLSEGLNLNDLKTAGRWVLSSGTGIATLELNYPSVGISGALEVVKNANSSLVTQKFMSWETGVPLLYIRMFRNSWSPWVALGVNINAVKDMGLLSNEQSLDDIKQTGFYMKNIMPGTDYESLGYPGRLTGVLSVNKSDSSSLVFQKFTSTTFVEYFRSWDGSKWSAWISYYLNQTNYMKILGTFTAEMHADNLKNEFSIYIVNNNSLDLVALGLPVKSTGVLKIYKGTVSSFAVQEFTGAAGVAYTRSWNNVTWSAWKSSQLSTTNYMKILSTFTAAMHADDLKTEFATYIVNSTSIDSVALGLPVKSLGVLKVYKGTVSSFVVQEFTTTAGVIYTRSWNNVTWSAWVSSDKSGPAGTSDLIQFTKTESAMQWYLPNSGTGTNKVRHTFNRGITPENNRDSWGMGAASIFSSSNAFLYNLTTTGVWEVAIVDAENISDHSGGGHGDEVKSLSYFMVDGIYKPEDFVETFTAKEVKHVQRSTIYVEAQNVPMCTRETTWTFNKNGCNSKTRLIFDTVRTITKARISMLPIYRKSNQDGTGEQITDTEIRSQDLTPIDVSVHGFERRDLPIKDGDSILLCSDISKISANVVIKKIKAVDPHAYVQNTILYNKVYVNAFAETAPAHTTTAGEVWEVETDFIISVRS